MRGAKTEIKGLQEMLATFKALPAEFRGRPVQTALRRATKIAQEDAIARAPQDDGRLKENIKLRRVSEKNRTREDGDEAYEVYVRRSPRKKRDDPSNAWYWRFVEFGTQHQAAQPFLRPAIENNQGAMRVEYTDTFKRLLDRAVNRARKGKP